jgi:hypothetical protein
MQHGSGGLTDRITFPLADLFSGSLLGFGSTENAVHDNDTTYCLAWQI